MQMYEHTHRKGAEVGMRFRCNLVAVGLMSFRSHALENCLFYEKLCLLLHQFLRQVRHLVSLHRNFRGTFADTFQTV